MHAQQALDLIAELPGREIRKLWDAGEHLPGYALEPGLWLGRNGGMLPAMKWAVRTLVRRDYFAKLVLDGFGVNVRVRQDGSHELRPSSAVADGVVVDLPFALTEQGLDYGVHVLGANVGSLLQMRDYLRAVSFETVAEVAPEEHVDRVGAARGDRDEGTLVLGYIAPLGLRALGGTPFGMVWHREATEGEEASARAWIERRRFVDSCIPA